MRCGNRKIPVEDGVWSEFVRAGTENEVISFKVLKRKDEKVKMNEIITSKIAAPIIKGKRVGRIYWTVNNVVIHIEEICTKESISKKTIRWCLKKIFSLWTLTV